MKKTLLLFISGIAMLSILISSSTFAATYNFAPKGPTPSQSLKPIIVKYKQKNYTGAMQDLEELVKKEPHNTYAKYYLALCYTRLGFREEAKILYTEVIKKDENLALSHYSQFAIDCLDDPSNPVCNPKAASQEEEIRAENPSDIDLFIQSGRRIHPTVVDKLTKEKMERKLEEDEYRRKQLEEEKQRANYTSNATIPTNEEIASALNTLSKIGINPYNQFNPLAQAQQFNQYGAMGLNNYGYNNNFNNPMNATNPDLARMLIYSQMTQKQNNMMNYGI